MVKRSDKFKNGCLDSDLTSRVLVYFYDAQFFALGVLGGTGTYSVPLRASTPSHDWGFQAPEIVGGQGRRGPHV